MWTMINGEISGVVNDFDLAIIFVESETHEPEGERTGTRIFMASELVENLDNSNGIAHIYGVFCFMHGCPYTVLKLSYWQTLTWSHLHTWLFGSLADTTKVLL